MFVALSWSALQVALMNSDKLGLYQCQNDLMIRDGRLLHFASALLSFEGTVVREPEWLMCHGRRHPGSHVAAAEPTSVARKWAHRPQRREGPPTRIRSLASSASGRLDLEHLVELVHAAALAADGEAGHRRIDVGHAVEVGHDPAGGDFPRAVAPFEPV
jgi:hypothetical protein